MKSAKEMFEELGYQKVRDSENSLIYDKADIFHYYQILFNKNDKTVSIKYNHLDVTYTTFFPVDIKLFMAIQKQLEELGWL